MFYINNLQAQNITNELNGDSTDIYRYSLEKFCNHVIKYYPNVKTINLEYSPLITDVLPNKVNGLEIKTLDRTEIQKMTKGHKQLFVVRITPLRSKGNMFYIVILPLIAHIENKKLMFMNQGGMKVSYKLNIDSKEFEFIDMEGAFGKME